MRRDGAAPEGGEVSIDCPLEALPRVGIVVGHVRDADTSQPSPASRSSLTTPQHKELAAQRPTPSGGFKFDGVAPGTAQLSVEADGYLVLVVPPTSRRARRRSRPDAPAEAQAAASS